MSRLDEVRKNVTEMTEPELREYIRHLRNDRRTVKATRAVKKVKAVNSDKAKDKIKGKLGKMSQAQLLALLAEVEGTDDATT